MYSIGGSGRQDEEGILSAVKKGEGGRRAE